MTNKFVEGYPSVEQEREVGLDRAIAEKLQEPEETQWKGAFWSRDEAVVVADFLRGKHVGTVTPVERGQYVDWLAKENDAGKEDVADLAVLARELLEKNAGVTTHKESKKRDDEPIENKEQHSI